MIWQASTLLARHQMGDVKDQGLGWPANKVNVALYKWGYVPAIPRILRPSPPGALVLPRFEDRCQPPFLDELDARNLECDYERGRLLPLPGPMADSQDGRRQYMLACKHFALFNHY